MNKNHLKACTKHPISAMKYIMERLGGKRMNDLEYLQFYYCYVRGKEINIEKPESFTEKLNWMKVYDHNSLYTTLVDKYLVKDYVSHIVGTEYVIPTIGVWDNADDIDFDSLPDKFVLKCNHDSGRVFICKDKSNFDFVEAKRCLNEQLNKDYYQGGREWVYKDVPRKVIAEEYIEDLADNNYKFFCFRGKVKALYVAPYREKYVDYFDENYNHLDIYTELHGPAPEIPAKPQFY